MDLTVISASDPGTAVILELKQTPDEKKDKVPVAQEAVTHLSEKYAGDRFTGNGVRSIFAFGACFCRKQCSVVCSRFR